MKISAKKSDLQDALQKVFRPINPRNPLPILTHIKCEAGKKGVTFSATDLMLSIKLTMKIEVQEEGAVTIPAKRLLDIVREISGNDSEIIIASDPQSHIKITCAHTNSRFEMVGGSAAEYPVIETVKEQMKFTLGKKELQAMVHRTAFAAASMDETRAYLTGLNIVNQKNLFTVVATNSHKLALENKPVKGKKIPANFNVIVPARAMIELSKSFTSDEGEIEIGIAENQIAFHDDNILLMARLIDETYPAYEKVIPQKGLKNKVRIDPLRLEEALRRMAIMCDEKTRMVKLNFNKNQLQLTGASGMVGGEAEEQMEVEMSGKGAVEVAFNVDYLKEIVQQFSEGDLEIQLTDGAHPCLFLEPGNDAYLCLLMPMRS